MRINALTIRTNKNPTVSIKESQITDVLKTCR